MGLYKFYIVYKLYILYKHFVSYLMHQAFMACIIFWWWISIFSVLSWATYYRDHTEKIENIRIWSFFMGKD